VAREPALAADRVVRLADGLVVGTERNVTKRRVHELQW